MEEEHHQQQEQPSSSQPPAPPPTEPPPTEPPPPQQQQQPLPTTSSSSPPPPSPSPSILSPSLQSTPNPNNNPTILQSQSQQPTTSQPSLPRPSFGRPWQPPISSPLSLHPNFPSSSPHSSPGLQRGGMAIGVPASGPPSSFSPSFNQPFGGLARASVNFPEAGPGSSTNSQVRQPMQGMGMMGSLGSGSSLRPSWVNAPHPQRPIQSSPRPQGGSVTQPPAAQNFQGPGILRAPSVGSPGSPSPNATQSSQPHNQPWLSSESQGKPPLPPPSYRPQMNPQSLQQRSHIPQQQQQQPQQQQQQQQQQQHTISIAAQQFQTSPSPQSQPPALSHQPQEQYSMQQSRIPQSLAHQQQIARGRGLGNQKPSSQPIGQFSGIQASTFNKTAATVETGESCNRILSKRSIQELVMQVDPSERLDPEVEDILVDLADEFVESITTFGCSLAKHRKSNTLEAKDILLHLERTWNMTLPGFSGDEIKIYKKPSVNETHKERLAVIKRTITAAETINSKGSAGQTAGGNAKSHPAKAPGPIIGSPNPKVRETA